MEINSTLTPIYLGRVDYLPTYHAMQDFSTKRALQGNEYMRDELWICEHNPVFTQGLAGKSEHIFNPADIPVVPTNRGGQVTYHGPGQVVAYPMLDLKRAGYFVKEYVYRIEEAVIRTLLYFGVTGHRVAGAPGIYVRLDDPASHAMLPQRPMKVDTHVGADENNDTPAKVSVPNFEGLGKIGALGIKVSRNFTYHGVALNVAMDLEPYSRINPCGYSGLQTVDLSTIGVFVNWQEAANVLCQILLTYLTP